MANPGEELRITPIIFPTEVAIAKPGVYANYVRVVHSEVEVALYFFYVPPDLFSSPVLKAQVSNPDGSLRMLDGKVEVRLDPVAKLILPPSLIPNMSTVLSENYQQWVNTFQKKEG